MGPYGTIQDNTGNIWDHTGPNKTIQYHVGPYGTIQYHGPNRTNLRIFKTQGGALNFSKMSEFFQIILKFKNFRIILVGGWSGLFGNFPQIFSYKNSDASPCQGDLNEHKAQPKPFDHSSLMLRAKQVQKKIVLPSVKR